jgi:hypothetical protein
MEDLKYPIGKFVMPSEVSEISYVDAVDSIAELPANLMMVLKDMDEIFLDTPYRPEVWTVRQVIHHLADSHC